MDQMIAQFIAKKLLEDVDIEEVSIQMGKTIWFDFEIDDQGDSVAFVNLYTEIPLHDIKELAYESDLGVHEAIDQVKILTTGHKELIVKYVFNESDQLSNYSPDLGNIEVHNVLSENEGSFIIDINLIAKPVGGE